MSKKAKSTVAALCGRWEPGTLVRSTVRNSGYAPLGVIGTVVMPTPLMVGGGISAAVLEQTLTTFTMVRWDTPYNEGPWREADLRHGSAHNVWWVLPDQLVPADEDSR